MYLNDPNHLQIQDVDSLEANELVMAYIHDNMIEPMNDKDMLDHDQLSMLKVIAQKANAYETLMETQDSSHYRN